MALHEPSPPEKREIKWLPDFFCTCYNERIIEKGQADVIMQEDYTGNRFGH
ncbi:hypothetical protein [Leptospirillum ferriphilum]|jgi:hypothetical protein|uniref:hypothetical protein n=1 Tax=Leptospirillum ferriphilum TaxID=178606 RepID=UPI0002FCDB35|nr:hypothetical protein [Leptospirillum ferriphilum]